MDSKELFNKIRNNQISYSDVLKNQELFLKELNNAKIGGKNDEQKKLLILSKFFTNVEKKFLIFLETMLK